MDMILGNCKIFSVTFVVGYTLELPRCYSNVYLQCVFSINEFFTRSFFLYKSRSTFIGSLD